MPNWYTLQHHAPMPQPGPRLYSERFTTPRTSLRITTTRDNGCESCEIGYPQRMGDLYLPAWLPEPLDAYRIMGHTTVSDGSGLIFQGRLSGPMKFVGGHIKAITAAGYKEALTDFDFSSSDSTSTTSGAIIKLVLLQSSLPVSIDQEYWADPGVAHAPNEFTNQNAASVVQTLLNEGSGTPADLQFWPGPNDTIVAQLRNRVAPDVEDFAFDWVADDQVVDLTFTARDMAGHVRAEYTPPSSSQALTGWNPDIEDTSFRDARGFDRFVTISVGQMTAAGAEQIRDTTYALRSVPQWYGTIRCSSRFPLQAIDGSPVAHGSIRAGRWVRVRGLTDPGSTVPVLLQIQQTVYDVGADTLELTVSRGMTRRTLGERMAETVDAVRANRNPVSAAKAV